MIAEPGSFRDPTNRVFYQDGQVFRSLNEEGAAHWRQLSESAFFKKLVSTGTVVGSETENRPSIKALISDHWASIVRHERIPFITYPYEWTFGMLKDAALLQLDILEQALASGWTLKDGSAYNVQWRGQRPVFIDVSSFEPYRPGDSWIGYRQFCMMFIIPLLLKAHRDIDTTPLCRSNLEGIDPEEALKYMSLRDLFRCGVFAHVYLHAKLQSRAQRTETKPSPPAASHPKRPIGQTREMALRMTQSIGRMVEKLERKSSRTAWSAYEETHSYDDNSFLDKKAFIERHVRTRRWSLIYDLGCNTGTFSRLCSEHADHIVAIDQDELAVDKLYRRLCETNTGNITPLVMQLSNMSPDQGWRGRERQSFMRRARPDLILCLALIHHLIISASIPMQDLLAWIRSFEAAIIFEFVGPEDEMVLRLLKNRRNPHPGYTQDGFETAAASMFEIADSVPLKGGRRRIYLLQPKRASKRSEVLI